MKAIQTRYAGCHFRSRLEARWAVFFDALKIEWQYEPEGFNLPSGNYLPDFRLPRGTSSSNPWANAWTKSSLHLPIWVEVKGALPLPQERTLAGELAESSGNRVYFGLDIPREITCRGIGGAEVLMLNYVVSSSQSWLDTGDFVIGSGIQGALGAARSARFEHGHSGVS